MEVSASRPSCPVDYVICKYLETVAVVSLGVPDNLQDACPAPPEPDDLISFPVSPDGNGPDGGVEPRNISATCQDPDHTFDFLLVCHFKCFVLFDLNAGGKSRIFQNHIKKVICCHFIFLIFLTKK